jgi:hypothetical protein
MKLISCDTMRDGIIASLSFLIIGGGLVFLAQSILPNVFYLPQITSLLGIACILFSPVILIGTFITTVLPGSKKKMDECDR